MFATPRDSLRTIYGPGQYVDDSVPASVLDRIRKAGGQIVKVDGPSALWPGPMWRLLALDDLHAHRILFRDADSVISRREAAAVEQWIASGKRFHMMRDSGSHTELMLAGLWGVVNGSLPPLHQLMDRFMSAPLESAHFADQHFLRQYVWPYARTSLMQHDSMFGFMGAAAFPDEKAPDDPGVGYGEGAAAAIVKTDLPDGSPVTWELYWIDKPGDGQTCEKLVCSYTDAVHNGTLKVHLPSRYMRQSAQRTVVIKLDESKAAAQSGQH